MPKTERKEQVAEATATKKEVEPRPEVILCNKVQEATISLVETVEVTRAQEDFGDPMEQTGEHNKGQDPLVEDKWEDQTNIQTAR